MWLTMDWGASCQFESLRIIYDWNTLSFPAAVPSVVSRRTFSSSIKGRVERNSLAVILPQHFSVYLIGAWVHCQHQVEMRPQPLGDPPEAILEERPELSGSLRVWLHQRFEAGPHFGLQSQSTADLSLFNVTHKLLPTILQDRQHQIKITFLILIK